MTTLDAKVPCARCGQLVDRIRAPRVRFSVERQLHFCCPEHADDYPWSLGSTQPGEVQLGARPESTRPPRAEYAEVGADTPPPEVNARQPAAATEPSQDKEPEAVPAPSTRQSLRSREAQWAQWALPCLLAVVTLILFVQGRPYLAPFLALLALVVAYFIEHRAEGQDVLDDWPDVLRGDGLHLARANDGQGPSTKPSGELRPGEELFVEAGEVICVDGIVGSGEATIVPWHGAQKTQRAKVGDRIVAGAQLTSGQLGLVATKTGERRAFHVPTQFVREHAQLRIARFARWGLGPGMSLLSVALLRLQGHTWLSSLAAAIVVSGTYAIAGGLSRPRALLRAAWGEAARRGISYCSAPLFERAGQVNAVVFCARGTVLAGEPDVTEVHVWMGMTEQQVLSLAAGAESAVHHPVASSTLRAAHLRQVAIEACRGHHVSPGLGVVCSTSDGRSLAVGSREFLLREKISVAIAEETLRTLETHGNSTLLVALDGRLIGVLGLQDSLRAGARAAFQLLLDHKLEPILLSGDARATTEAVARALSCEHVRPEVPALSRAQTVRSLIDAGLTVAVVGNSPLDDVALGAAQVPVVLGGAATVRSDSPHGHERGVGLASDRVMDATLALLIAKQARHNLQVFLVAWLLLSTMGSLLVISQLAPLFVAPLFGLAGLQLGQRLAKRSGSLP